MKQVQKCQQLLLLAEIFEVCATEVDDAHTKVLVCDLSLDHELHLIRGFFV